MESNKNQSGQTVNGKVYKHDKTQFVTILRLMYKQRLFCDVALVAEGLEVPVHKIILASCSPYFYQKFSEDKETAKLDRIEIDNITHETLSSVITYLYSSQILISEDNVEDLLSAAHRFTLQDLQEACQGFIKLHLSPNNCLRFRNIATRFQYGELIKVITDYIKDHLEEVTDHDQFLQLSHEQVLDLIRSGVLCSEEGIPRCMYKWFECDKDNRTQDMSTFDAAYTLRKDPLT